jgi:mRNA-degrading endonuclease YafQ of YafQ-DinJ toxin-antitoxin module
MNKYLIFIFISTIFFTVACKKNSPSHVALQFLEALNNNDFAKAKKYCTEDAKKLMEIMEGMMKMVPKEQLQKAKVKQTITVLREETAGDKALIIYKSSKSDKEEQLKMKKIDGKWLVSMDKGDLGDKKNPFDEEKKKGGVDN